MKYYIQGFLITMVLYLLVFGTIYLLNNYPTALIVIMGIVVTVFLTWAIGTMSNPRWE